MTHTERIEKIKAYFAAQPDKFQEYIAAFAVVNCGPHKEYESASEICRAIYNAALAYTPPPRQPSPDDQVTVGDIEVGRDDDGDWGPKCGDRAWTPISGWNTCVCHYCGPHAKADAEAQAQRLRDRGELPTDSNGRVLTRREVGL